MTDGARRAVTGAAERGSALITALIMLTVLGLFLFGFQALNQNELGFAGYSRASTLAFNAAEAGAQEGIKRLNLFGGTPGTTCFANSMLTGGSLQCSPPTNAIVYQAPLSSNPTIFPILSVATVNSATRAVRVFEQALYKAGFSTVIFGPQIIFQGDTAPTIGDTYSGQSLTFQTYTKSPQPASGATALNLLSPQVMAGNYITTQGAGPGTFPLECSSGSLTEVAPTNCARGAIPVNWHPGAPIGMPSGDFNAVVTKCYATPCSLGGGDSVSVSQATQTQASGTVAGVTYAPRAGGYTPGYWSGSTSGTNGQVVLAVATAPFCVRSSPPAVDPPTGSNCPAGYTQTPYGVSNPNPGNCTTTSPSVSTCTRYLDWGLVSDDWSRAAATTFFQPQTCATCYSGGPNGNQNGIRYVPILPPVSVLPSACLNNEPSPGFSAFLNVTSPNDGLTCPNPPTQAGSGTFTGTQSSPEFLVIDNGGPGAAGVQVTISSSGTATGCSDNFANANWGIILATGDLNLQNFTFNGFIYTQGNVYSHGHVLVKGGIFSAAGSQNQLDSLGTLQFCGGSVIMPLSPAFYNFTLTTWQDRPAGSP